MNENISLFLYIVNTEIQLQIVFVIYITTQINTLRG